MENNINNDNIMDYRETDENGNNIPNDQTTNADSSTTEQQPANKENWKDKCKKIGWKKVALGTGLTLGLGYLGIKVIKAAKAANAPAPQIAIPNVNAVAQQAIAEIPDNLRDIGTVAQTAAQNVDHQDLVQAVTNVVTDGVVGVQEI